MKTFNAILDGYNTQEQALEYARGVVWCELETSEQTINHKTYIDTVDGVGVWYDYGADYYFFSDEKA